MPTIEQWNQMQRLVQEEQDRTLRISWRHALREDPTLSHLRVQMASVDWKEERCLLSSN